MALLFVLNGSGQSGRGVQLRNLGNCAGLAIVRCVSQKQFQNIAFDGVAKILEFGCDVQCVGVVIIMAGVDRQIDTCRLATGCRSCACAARITRGWVEQGYAHLDAMGDMLRCYYETTNAKRKR